MFSTNILKWQGMILGVCLFLTYLTTIIINYFTYSNSWILSAYGDHVGTVILMVGAVFSLGIILAVLVHNRAFLVWSFGLLAIFHAALAVANAYVFSGLGSQMFFLIFIALMAGIRSAYYSLDPEHVNVDKQTTTV